MEKKYDKPFKTYLEQLNILKEKYGLNLNFSVQELEIIKSISYYDIVNGYKECFMDKNDTYLKGTTLNFMFKFLQFDKNFQNILFKYSVFAENNFKTNLAYSISNNFGVEADSFLKEDNFQKFDADPERKYKLEKLLRNIKRTSLKTKDPPTNFYRENHNHIPPWVLFKNIKFNSSIDLYSALKGTDKKEIYEEYLQNYNISKNDKTDFLKNMLTIVRKFRNKIAHNGKFITYNIENKYQLLPRCLEKIFVNAPLVFSKDDIKTSLGRRDIYGMILALTILIKNKALVLSMLQEINFLFSTESKIINKYINITKLPDNFIFRINKLAFYVSEEQEKSKNKLIANVKQKDEL
ncbi:Abi family protein [Fusobacterium sp. IOR10]|uniref:Abi family protein n=1 Tax=Fusobacterium sp. IOR10 TaxID=2665157 RepID=UPI0013D36D1E|nr:Abi family protein [Fusobacterium sp. IOR10]